MLEYALNTLLLHKKFGAFTKMHLTYCRHRLAELARRVPLILVNDVCGMKVLLFRSSSLRFFLVFFLGFSWYSPQ